MIELRDLRKSYKTGDFVQKALDGASVTFRDSEFVAILGPSGSGKTTLLNIVGGLDHADSGELVINGVSTRNYGSKDWDTYRNHHVGFVFQSYNLIPHQSILSNVELALTLTGVSRAERKRRATEALKKVGLGDHINKRPSQLSGGQMQRVAIARALVNDPDIVLADEPTGALDTQTGIQVMDLLAEVAQERLVVMVTHNPELAEQYATRIVNIADGKITGDSNPFDSAAADDADDTAVIAPLTATVGKHGKAGEKGAGEKGAAAGAPTADATKAAKATAGARASSGEGRHASMSFLTALSLSFSNLMAKKGRTFLTAFAGSIGIMGIAAILALSNGVNNYIDKVQEDALSSSPLTITESSFDVTSIMTQAATYTSEGGEEADGTVTGSDVIPESTVMSDILTDIKNNDLESFRTFLESGESDVYDHVNAITYNYGITPLIYASDTTDGVKQLNPSSLATLTTSSVSSLMSSTGSGMGFQEMIQNQELLDSQYEVVMGSWPQSYDECVLVLSDSGGLSDYTLYSLGVLDPDTLEDMLTAAVSGEEIDVPDASTEFTYDDAMSLTFKVVNPCNLYTKSEDGATWTDRSGDAPYLASAVENGLELRIVGVVRPRETASSTSMSEGIGYTHDLILYLMDQAASSQIVGEQLANPDVDVFTGKTFDELQDDAGVDFDMADLFTIDEDAMAAAFQVDTDSITSAMTSAMSGASSGMGDVSFDDAPTPDFSDLELDTSALEQAMAEQAVSQAAAQSTAITSAMEQAASGVGSAVIADFASYVGEQLQTGEVDLTSEDAMSTLMASYQESGRMDAIVQQVVAAAQEAASSSASDVDASSAMSAASDALMASFSEAIQAKMADYMTNQFTPYLEQKIASMMTSYAQNLSTAMASALSSSLGTAVGVDNDAFANAIQVNMDQDDLTSLLTNLATASELSYDANLTTLGYADIDRPKSISIYAKSFEDKQIVEDIIEDYNTAVEEAGEEDKSISYSDITGVLMSSVTSIVNMISTVLIAFVSVSLVVSSIMISIITYISVLERRKEIGILRAMGASKINVANIFNAETIIEGLFAGILAIAVVLAASVPVNAIVYQTHNVEHIMKLPAGQAAILIAISVVLTFIAGLIPSTMAAGRDPVEALRSE